MVLRSLFGTFTERAPKGTKMNNFYWEKTGNKYTTRFHDTDMEVFEYGDVAPAWPGKWIFHIDGHPRIPAYFESAEVAMGLAEKCVQEDYEEHKREYPALAKYKGYDDNQDESVEAYVSGIKALQSAGFKLCDFTIENFDHWYHVSANFGSSSYCIALTVAFDLKEWAEVFLEKVKTELAK